MDKARWLEIAEVLDALRVFPRLLLVASAVFTGWYAWYALHIVVGLVNSLSGQPDSTVGEMIAQNIVAGVIGFTVPLVGQVLAKIADVYLSTGRKWENKP